MKHAHTTSTRPRAAFTLIELLVAVSLLVLVMLGVGQVFRTVSRSIRISNATIETDANVRAAMRQFTTDVSRIDRDGFLVIRSNLVGGGVDTVRANVSFIAHGNHANATGGMDPAAAASSDLNATAAHVWYGFALNPVDFTSNGGKINPGSTIQQDSPVQLTDRSKGSNDNMDHRNNLGFLGRHAFLLLPGNNSGNPNQITAPGGGIVPAHTDISATAANITVRNTSPAERLAHPSSGRTSVAAITPSQLMTRMRLQKYQPIRISAHLVDSFPYNNNGSWLQRRLGIPAPIDGVFSNPVTTSYQNLYLGDIAGLMPQYDGSDYWSEARLYCYPFRVLRDPREGVDAAATTDFVNGASRMSSILLKYCVEFRVEWTDGQLDSTNNIRWMGHNPNNSANCLDNLNDPGSTFGQQPRQWPPVDFYTPLGNASSAYGARSILPPVSDLTPRSGSVNSYAAPYNSPSLITGDNYNAIFGFDRRTQWPKALRVTIRLQMIGLDNANFDQSPNWQIPTRTYTQIVWLPQ